MIMADTIVVAIFIIILEATWLANSLFFMPLIVSFMIAHAAIAIRLAENRTVKESTDPGEEEERNFWLDYGSLPCVYAALSTVISKCCGHTYVGKAHRLNACEIRPDLTPMCDKSRGWSNASGWMEAPNTVSTIQDARQLLPIGVLIIMLDTILTGAWKRDGKGAERRGV
jgi:hypothetical protein